MKKEIRKKYFDGSLKCKTLSPCWLSLPLNFFVFAITFIFFFFYFREKKREKKAFPNKGTLSLRNCPLVPGVPGF
jgi:hypothetical protein